MQQTTPQLQTIFHAIQPVTPLNATKWREKKASNVKYKIFTGSCQTKGKVKTIASHKIPFFQLW
jgi:hypothetical protein